MGDAEKSSLPHGRELAVRAAVVAGALIVAGVVFRLRFCGAVDLEPRPAAPAVVASAGENADDAWTRQVADDARTLRLQRVPDRGDLAAPFPHQLDAARHRLDASAPLETAGLRLTLVTVDDAQALRIDNLSPSPVAYRVDARPERCRIHRQLRHDALVLREQGTAGDSAVRGMCAGRAAVVVSRVETVQVPLLSYHYVGRLRPSLLGLDEEWIGAHVHEGSLPACDIAIPALLQGDISAGRTTWLDLVDFYATHSCEKYEFPQGYRALAQGNRVLP
ncbi:MAG TPA: hypothetical protein VL172_02325 [Kofleriaceae bacterium]|nr:hypothetical protein [Kofleriaceae bacterium]